MTFFRGFTWTGHFIEMKICLERGPQGDEGPGCAARARGALRTPFFPRTPFKGKCVRGIICSLYQAILYKVGRKASSELYMGDFF